MNYLSISSAATSVSSQPKIVILGAGPAGLACALEIIKNGGSPIILEKRNQNACRLYPVILYEDTIEQLESSKIYSYLLNQNLIFPMHNHRCTVRLADLEQGLRQAIKDRTGSNNPIQYQKTVAQVIETGNKVDLLLTNGDRIGNVDIVINTEGSHSSTNELLNNGRTAALDDLRAVYSILRDDRPQITNLGTLLEYSVKTIRNLALSILDHTRYLFLLLFKGEHFFSSSRRIAIAATLKTPGQHRVGFAFTEKMDEKLEPKTLQYWTRMALCEVNVFSVIQRIGRLFGGGKTDNQLSMASHLPIESTNLITIRSDRAERAAIIKNNTLFLIGGDALSTVDPSAVFGCNTALQLGPQIQQAVIALKEGRDLRTIADSYTKICNEWIERNHAIARQFRKRFNPTTKN